MEAGQSFHGTFVINGDSLELSIAETNTITTAVFRSGKLTDNSGQIWKLQDDSSQLPIVTTSAESLRNEDVVKMVKAGLDDSIVLSKIKTSTTQFNTDPDTLIILKANGVSSAVLKAMTEASAKPQVDPRSRTTVSGSALPTSYGAFLLDGMRYRPLTPTKISVVVGLRLKIAGNGFAVDGFSGDPPQSIVRSPSEILVYQQNVDMASVHLSRMELLLSLQAYQFNIVTTVNTAPELYPSLYGVDYDQVNPVNLWRPLSQGIPMRIEPVVERNGMFRLMPEATLSPGRYALYFGESIHASDIIVSTRAGVAGTAFYFEVR
jgi:hypothetical protein